MPRVLVVGGGGREHALAAALVRSPSKPEVLVAPGNAGIAAIAECVAIGAADVVGLVALAESRQVDLVVVGPEAPLVLGLADRLREKNIAVLGPSQRAARLEGSKSFAKMIMAEAGVPTARGDTFDAVEPAVRFIDALGGRAVVKADGLAAGKGVVVAEDRAEAVDAVRSILGGAHGEAGRSIVVEELLEGEELSVLALSDGERVAVLAPAQDHKRVFDGDRGPNTGGMGAYSPAPRGTPELLADVEARCLRPIVEVMKRRGELFSGVLYAGLMLTKDGPRVLEYNARFGDPEAEVILPRLDEDAFLLFSAVARGQLRQETIAFKRDAALTVVLAAEHYPGEPTKGDAIRGLEQAGKLPGVSVYHAATRREGSDLVTQGGRVLAVTGMGADLEAAARTAYGAVRAISFRGMHYRKDIGMRAIGRAIGAEV